MKNTAIAVLGLMLGVVAPSFAGKAVESGTISLNELNPRLGDTVTFKVSFTPSNLDKSSKGGVRIQVMCFQNGGIVYGEAAHHDQPFLLGGGSSMWLNSSPGPAECKADLYYWSYQGGQKFNELGTMSFSAGGK